MLTVCMGTISPPFPDERRGVVVSTVREESQWLKNVAANEQTAVWFCGRRLRRVVQPRPELGGRSRIDLDE